MHLFLGVSKMGECECGFYWDSSGHKCNRTSTVFPELCPNLVWYNAAWNCTQ